jgi:hypothetical protein
VLLYYAAGGGLGHVTRARAFLHGAGLDATILTSASVPEELRDDLPAYREWLRGLGATRIIVDTFPAGLFHEFDEGEWSCAFDYVARYVVWPRYAAMHKPPRFETAYVLEPLHEEQERFVVANSSRVERNVRLMDPPAGESARRYTGSSYTLVVHSGDADEVEELIEYAHAVGKVDGELPILVATQAEMHRDDVTIVDAYPVGDLADHAARIITGAGFNCMRQFGGDPRHRAIPFPRRFDDQFLRAARYRSSDTSMRSNCEPRSLRAR